MTEAYQAGSLPSGASANTSPLSQVSFQDGHRLTGTQSSALSEVSRLGLPSPESSLLLFTSGVALPEWRVERGNPFIPQMSYEVICFLSMGCH